MPSPSAPWKSGVHRTASIALFRALLKKSANAKIGEKLQRTLRDVVRNSFKYNRYEQSKHRMAAAFMDGYEVRQPMTGLYSLFQREWTETTS